MMAGVTVGIASLTILGSIGESTRLETMKRFKNMLGTFDTVIIRPGAGKNRGMVSLTNVDQTLTFSDADAVEHLPAVRQLARLQNAFDIDVKYRDRDATPAIFGVSPNFLELRGDQVAEGRFFSDEENRALTRVAIVGSDARAALFPDDDPLGKTIRVGDVPFEVIGVLRPRGAGPAGGSLDNLVFIPVNTASKRLFNRDFLTMLIAQIRDPSQPQSAVGQISSLLRSRHHLTGAALDDFNLTSPHAVMSQVTRLGASLRRLLKIVAVLAMLVAGIVIFSITLIGISERRREIGIRRAVGAVQSAVLLQFLCEAMTLSFAGGLAGIAIGIGGTQMIAQWQHLPFLIERKTVLLAAGISVMLGIVCALYPAWKASKLNPVDALRA
jgi:putative ABC transport system permease protein